MVWYRRKQRPPWLDLRTRVKWEAGELGATIFIDGKLAEHKRGPFRVGETWIKPSGVQSVSIEIWGAGGGVGATHE